MKIEIYKMFNSRVLWAIILLFLILGLFLKSKKKDNQFEDNNQSKFYKESFIHKPILFEENVGQFPDDFPFVSRGPGFTLFLKNSGFNIILQTEKQKNLIGLNLVNSNKNAEIQPLAKHRKKTYDISAGINTSIEKNSDILSYSQILAQDIYNGISVLYYGNTKREFEYDFIIDPGADYKKIIVQSLGIEKLELIQNGSLSLKFDNTKFDLKKPIAYQNIDGKRKDVYCEYKLYSDKTFGFSVGEYDKNYKLIIDPVLIYSTFLGGNGNDIGNDITVDKYGYVYITGTTTSSDFPTSSTAFDISGNVANTLDQGDVFITKLDTNGSDIIYSTYISGKDLDIGNGIAVDSKGCVFVIGTTFSKDDTTTQNVNEGFPFVNPFYSSDSVGGNIFVLKLNETGSDIVFSGLLGATNSGQENPSITIDNSDNIYVAGGIGDKNFPTTSNAFRKGDLEPFAVKINSNGSIEYSTQLGGNNFVFVQDIAVDKFGQAYITGFTGDQNLPTTTGAYKESKAANFEDIFIYKLNSDGSDLLYCTYLGGDTDDDFAYAVVVDSNGNAIITGNSFANDYPITYGNLTNQNTIVTMLDSEGSSVLFSSEISGSVGKDIHNFENGYLGIISEGSGGNFKRDVVLTLLDIETPQIYFETFLGGIEDDIPMGMCADKKGNLYITGKTSSKSFPGEEPKNKSPFQSLINTVPDGFVMKYSIFNIISAVKNKIVFPSEFFLEQNYPNPFNPNTTIKYSIQIRNNVTLKVFDVLGGELTTLVDKEQAQGNYEVEFDGSDLTSGIYIYLLKSGNFVETRKMILLK